jgi:hypothetical protein
MTEYNMKRHYSTKHSQYETFQGQLRNDKIENEKGTIWAILLNMNLLNK